MHFPVAVYFDFFLKKLFFLKILFFFQELDIINIGINLKSDILVNQEIESCQRLE